MPSTRSYVGTKQDMAHQQRWFTILAGLALLGVAAVAAACEESRTGDDPFMGAADPNAPYDQRFIDEMVMHHRGAILSARMLIGDSQRPELRDLARRIEEGQQRQIELMQEWRAGWYGTAAVPAMGMDPMAGMMDGMMNGDGGMMRGQDREQMFLRMMIPHHQLAIDMAEDALENAEHEELKGLAREIVADQSAEIAEMEGYLRDWYGESSTRGMAGGMRDMMRRMPGR